MYIFGSITLQDDCIIALCIDNCLVLPDNKYIKQNVIIFATKRLYQFPTNEYLEKCFFKDSITHHQEPI